MQFQYSLLDIPNEDDLSGRMKQVTLPHIPETLRGILAKFFVPA
jgi:hypothetical protein